MRAHQLAFFKTVEAEFFVRRMGVVIRQAEAEEQRVRTENFFELIDDGDRAALAHENRLVTKGFFQRAQRGLRRLAGGRDEIGFRTVPRLDLEPHGRRTNFFQVREHGFVDTFRLLIRH